MGRNIPGLRARNAAEDDRLYDLVPVDEKPARSRSRSVLPPPAAVQPIDYSAGATRGAESADEAFPDKVLDLYAPLGMIGGALVIEIVAALIRASHVRGSWPSEIAGIGGGLILSTAAMLIALQIAARLRGFSFGPFGSGVLKLIAIALTPAAAVTLASPLLAVVPLGWVVGLVGQFVLYFALLGALFKLDESDTWYCICVIFLVNLALYFAAMAWPALSLIAG
jgi:hypothetical protein